MSKNSAVALAGLLGLPDGVAPTPSVPKITALSCLSYGGADGGQPALTMRSTIMSMLTYSLFIALMIIDSARTLSFSCKYQS